MIHPFNPHLFSRLLHDLLPKNWANRLENSAKTAFQAASETAILGERVLLYLSLFAEIVNEHILVPALHFH
jgi:hypothetical protein